MANLGTVLNTQDIVAAVLPNQTGQSGKVMSTDGTNPSWISQITTTFFRPSVEVLDSTDTAKPTVNPTIDGVTIALNDRVLFTGLTGGELADNNKVWKATVSLNPVTWVLELDGQAGTGAPTNGDAISVTGGTSFGNKIFVYGSSLWNQVQSVSGVALTANNLSDVASTNTSLNNLLPSQTGNSGKFLTTDGTNGSWGTPAGGSGSSIKNTFSSLFENSTRYSSVVTSGGSATFGLQGLLMSVNSTASSAITTANVTNASIRFLGGTTFSCTVNPITYGSTFDFYVGSGNISVSGASVNYNSPTIGFRLNRTGGGSTTLQGCVGDGAGNSNTIVLATPASSLDVLELIWVTNAAYTSVTFYYRLNGSALSAGSTISSNLPPTAVNQRPFMAGLSNKATASATDVIVYNWSLTR